MAKGADELLRSRVHGHVILHGERVDIDCLAMRDRTWGPRPGHRPRRAAYVTADVDAVAYGFLWRNGRTVGLAAGERRVVRSAEHGWVEHIELDATDDEGRGLRAVGTPASRTIINGHMFIDIGSLVRWKLDDGTEAWGEDHDMWPVHAFAAARRAARGGRP